MGDGDGIERRTHGAGNRDLADVELAQGAALRHRDDRRNLIRHDQRRERDAAIAELVVGFRPAIDETGKPVDASIDMKVELRPSTANTPKPVAANADPQLTEKEKARIRQMKCSDFRWEWELLREEADDAADAELGDEAIEFPLAARYTREYGGSKRA